MRFQKELDWENPSWSESVESTFAGMEKGFYS